MFRIRGVFLLLLALLLLGSCGPGAETPLAMRPPAGSRAEMVVMSFNIRYGTAEDGDDAWPRRRAQVFDLLRRHDADVIGLQEALRFQLDEIHGHVPGYLEIGVGRRDGGTEGEYAAILLRASRFAIVESGRFWLSGTPGVPGSRTWGNRVTRICTWTRVHDRHRGRELYVFNTHLDHESQPSRALSVELIRRRMRERRFDDPILLLGDFNAAEGSPEIGDVIAPGAEPVLIETFRAVHPDAIDVGTFGGFAGRRDGPKIDYVFASPGLLILDAAIVHDRAGGRDPSDHYPVTATVRLP